jgi:hypothetical protein
MVTYVDRKLLSHFLSIKMFVREEYLHVINYNIPMVIFWVTIPWKIIWLFRFGNTCCLLLQDD